MRSSILPIAVLSLVASLAAPASAEVAMFSQRNFQGARYDLIADSPNMNFSPRSVRITEAEAWQLCPRPFFGGACIAVKASSASISLPRAFSGVVRSARPLPSSASQGKAAPQNKAEPPKEEDLPKEKDKGEKS
jgi:hypothetical protein